MTREEAEYFLRGISYKLGNIAVEYLSEKDGEKMREAIKALAQEPVIDKIRAEIERLQKMCDENDLNLMAQYSAFGMVLDILDKYKAESEETDGTNKQT